MKKQLKKLKIEVIVMREAIRLRIRRAHLNFIDRRTRKKYNDARAKAIKAINTREQYNLPNPIPKPENGNVKQDRYMRSENRYGRR